MYDHKEVTVSSSLCPVLKDIFQRNSVDSSGHLLLSNLWPIPPQIFGSTLQVSYNIITVSPIYLSLVNKHLFYCSCYVEQISSDPKQK